METITVITSGQNIQVVSINSAAQGPAGTSATVQNYGDNRILSSIGTSTGINAESNLTFNGTSLVINSGLTTSTGNFTTSISGSLLNIDNIRIDGNTITSTNNNGNLIIQTTGIGAIQRDTGGNSRGQYSVDFQNVRISGAQVAAGNYCVIAGGASNQIHPDVIRSSIVGGSGNQIYLNNDTNDLSNNFIGGGFYNRITDHIFETTTAVGSFIGGGYQNTIGANGAYNFIGGGYGNTISHANGGNNSVICGGDSNIIQGEYYGAATIGGGYGNIISESNDGQRIPEGATIPGGYEAKATNYAEFCHAAGKFSNAGDAQHTILIARKLTTDNTANVILLLDNGLSGSYKLYIPSKTTWTFEIKLSAYNDTDSAGGGWIFKGAIRSDGSGNTAIIGIGVTAESWLDTAMSTASADVVANDTTNSLDIRVTGLSGKNIRWVAVVDISQVSYGAP